MPFSTKNFTHIVSHPFIKIQYINTQMSSPFIIFHLTGLGGEQFIELCILREVIRKGQNDIVEKQQPVARLGVGHIGKLLRPDVGEVVVFHAF